MGYLSARDDELCNLARAMCACNQLRRAARAVTQHYDTVLAGTGLKATQLPILVALGLSDDLPVTTLADLLALDRTTLTRNLKVLAEHGLVEYRGHNGDARVRLVGMTEAGAGVLSEALEQWARVQTEVEERFDAPRLLALYDELATLSNVIVATSAPVPVPA